LAVALRGGGISYACGMGHPAQVALIGNSQAYLSVRAGVLQNFWLVETVALDQGELPEFTSELLVICASMRREEQQEWIELARHRMPGVLIVRVNGLESGPLAGADALVDDECGPGALVSAIYELLTERGLESRHWPELPAGGWLQ
jgi:hypothetical protein